MKKSNVNPTTTTTTTTTNNAAAMTPAAEAIAAMNEVAPVTVPATPADVTAAAMDKAAPAAELNAASIPADVDTAEGITDEQLEALRAAASAENKRVLNDRMTAAAALPFSDWMNHLYASRVQKVYIDDNGAESVRFAPVPFSGFVAHLRKHDMKNSAAKLDNAAHDLYNVVTAYNFERKAGKEGRAASVSKRGLSDALRAFLVYAGYAPAMRNADGVSLIDDATMKEAAMHLAATCTRAAANAETATGFSVESKAMYPTFTAALSRAVYGLVSGDGFKVTTTAPAAPKVKDAK